MTATHTRKPLILVAGAAGKTGAAAAQALLADGYSVRAFVRREDHRAAALKRAGAEVITGDLWSSDDLSQAMKGVRRAYFVAPWEPNQLHMAMNFAVAVSDARLESMVALSQWLAQPRHPSLATRETYMTDRVFALLPDTMVTTINVGWFADNYMAVLPYVAHLGLFPFPLGEGRNAPISNEDIGRVVARVLADPAPHAGKLYRPTGPKLMRPQDLADVYATVFGRRVRHLEMPDWMFRKALRAMGMSRHMQAQLRYYLEEYRRDAFAVGAPSDVVERLTGRPAEPFEIITERYAGANPGLKPGTANFLRALTAFLRIALTPGADLAAYERRQHHPRPAGRALSIDDREWRSTHGSSLAEQAPGPRAPAVAV